MILRRIVLTAVVVWLWALCGPAAADYLVVSRSATIKADAATNSPVLEKVAAGAELVLLDGGQKRNGYYRVSGVSQPQAGWIYGNLVRRRPGSTLAASPPHSGASASQYGICAEIFVAERPPTVRGKQITPLCEGDGEIAYFATGYSKADNRGIWSAYWVDRERVQSIEESTGKRARTFRKNGKLEDGSYVQPTHNDYTNSGYNRGHFAPSHGLAWDEEAQRATFQISNIAPQDGKMNQNIWRCFEVTILDWARNYGEIRVVVGGIGTQKTVGKKVSITVPTHYFAMVHRKEPQEMAVGVRVPNEGGHLDIRKWLMSVAELEEQTGIEFGLKSSIAAKKPTPSDWPVRNPTVERYIPDENEHCKAPTN